MRLNPFFVVDEKRYEIKRTRFLESEYDRLRNEEVFTDEQQEQMIELYKIQSEYQEFNEKLLEAKQNYFNDICNEEKERIYKKFKELCDEKYKELTNYAIYHKEASLEKIEKVTLNTGEKLLFIALQEQYKISEKEAISIWESYVDEIGVQSASEWIMTMINVLFQSGEDDDFLMQAKANALKKAEQRRGLLNRKK